MKSFKGIQLMVLTHLFKCFVSIFSYFVKNGCFNNSNADDLVPPYFLRQMLTKSLKSSEYSVGILGFSLFVT